MKKTRKQEKFPKLFFFPVFLLSLFKLFPVFQMELQNVAVAGATGYSGEELIRILMRHPGVELVAVTSRQHVGEPLESVFPKFQAHKFSELKFIHSDAKAIIASG